MLSGAFGRTVTVLLVAGIAVCCALMWRRGVPDVFKDEEQLEREQARLRLVERLVFRRTADVFVESVEIEEETGRKRCVLHWHEAGGGEVPPERVEIAGVQPRFEALIISFDPDRRRDPLAGRSLVLFRRAYGEHTPPAMGHSFADPSDPVPGPYRLAGIDPEIERSLWRRFWTLATDPAAAEEEGIAVMQAKAVSTRVLPRKWYRFTVAADGRADVTGPFDARPAR